MLEENEVAADNGQSDEESANARRTRPRRAATRPAGPPPTLANPFLPQAPAAEAPQGEQAPAVAPVGSPFAPVFQTPQLPASQERAERRPRRESGDQSDGAEPQADAEQDQDQESAPQESGASSRRSRRRGRGAGGSGGRARQESGDEESEAGGNQQGETGEPVEAADTEQAEAGEQSRAGEAGETPTPTKKRRRRRRGGSGDVDAEDDDPNTVTKVRVPKEVEPSDRVTGVKGSTRLEAKKQRRREGREAGRRRAPILSEAEFLARRESVDRAMVVRQREDVTQIAVLEDGVLVEHYVAKDVGASATMVGNIYLGRVQNVLPSMEAAFIDIGRGRNAVLYAGEVNWDAAGLEGQPKRIEFALKSGDSVLVQVTKDPIGHKGARLTSQISLPGRYLVFVPDGSMTGISRKLPDTERSRLRGILKQVVPPDVGVIVRTAAEGASEEEITRDVARLTKTWEDLQRKAATASPAKLLHAEPDLAIRVVRDIFNEDFKSLLVEGERAWQRIGEYLQSVAPDLVDRASKWTQTGDCFAHHRIDEQLAKALDRKVWLPSGGSLIIEHTEAMTVIDVNTGKFTGQGGDLEETVTQNNLEAAEEIVRQVRLRDIGGIIVIDFIDMVLESNRDLVLRRLVECLGRDRTKHQVTEITSLGLAQMTRKRIGGGLLETFSEPCEACNGRGVRVHMDAHAAPLLGRRRPVKPTGAHDPAEMMARAQHAEEPAETAPEPAAQPEVRAAEGEPQAIGDSGVGPAAQDAEASAQGDASSGSSASADVDVTAAQDEEPAQLQTVEVGAVTSAHDALAAAAGVLERSIGEAVADLSAQGQPEPLGQVAESVDETDSVALSTTPEQSAETRHEGTSAVQRDLIHADGPLHAGAGGNERSDEGRSHSLLP